MKDMKMNARKMAIKHFKEFIKDMMKEESLPEMEKMISGPKKMMKVAVASDSPEGLKKGLSKAEEILKAKMSEEGESEESSEMPEMKKCEACGKAECECPEMEDEEEYESEEE